MICTNTIDFYETVLAENLLDAIKQEALTFHYEKARLHIAALIKLNPKILFGFAHSVHGTGIFPNSIAIYFER